MKLKDFLPESPSGGQRGGSPAPSPAPGQSPTESPAAPVAVPSDPVEGQPQDRSTFMDIADFAYNNAIRIGGWGALGEAGDYMAEHGTDSASQAFGAGMIDFMSMGLADQAAAADYAIRKSLDKGDFSNFLEFYGDRKDRINLALEENRAEYPTASTLGAIAGGMATGMGTMGAVGKAAGPVVTKLGKWWGTVFSSSLASAGEAAMYRVNSDGTLEEVAADATLAGIGSAVLAPFIFGAGKLASNVIGRNATKQKHQAAKAFIDAIRINSKNPDIQPEEILAKLDAAGPKAIMADVYPNLRKFFSAAIASGDDKTIDDFIKLLGTRNAVESHLKDIVEETIKLPRYMSPGEFNKRTQDVFKALRPRYDKVLDAFEGTFSRKAINKGIRTLVGPMEETTEFERAALRELNKQLKMHSQRGPGGTITGNLTMRELHNAKRELGKKLGKVVSSKDKSPTGGLRAVYNYIDDVLSEADPEYAKLSKTYGQAFQQNQAYDLGYKMFGKRATTGAELANQIGGFESAGQINSYIHGVKARLLNDLKGKTPKQINNYIAENSRSFDKIRAIIGDERTDRLLNITRTAAEQIETDKALETALDRFKAPSGATGADILTDIRVAAETGGAASKRAQMARLTGKAPSASQIAQAGKMLGEGATATPENAPRILNEILNMQKGYSPGFIRGAGGFGGMMAGGLANAETPGIDQSVLDQFYFGGVEEEAQQGPLKMRDILQKK